MLPPPASLSLSFGPYTAVATNVLGTLLLIGVCYAAGPSRRSKYAYGFAVVPGIFAVADTIAQGFTASTVAAWIVAGLFLWLGYRWQRY
jgi:hypothetical protein